MPNVHRSFYTNMHRGYRYSDFVSQELLDKARAFFPLSSVREDNFVAGPSMGVMGRSSSRLPCPAIRRGGELVWCDGCHRVGRQWRRRFSVGLRQRRTEARLSARSVRTRHVARKLRSTQAEAISMLRNRRSPLRPEHTLPRRSSGSWLRLSRKGRVNIAGTKGTKRSPGSLLGLSKAAPRIREKCVRMCRGPRSFVGFPSAAMLAGMVSR